MSATPSFLVPPSPGGQKPPTAPPPVTTRRDDRVFLTFLRRQWDQGTALASQSDVLELAAIGAWPSQQFLAAFTCQGTARTRSGEIVVARRRHLVSIFFPDDYLRRAEVPQVLTWLGPMNVFSPHIAPPFICTGRINPGTQLVDLLYQVYEIITYHKVTPREDDALNRAACGWARNHLAQFPLERTPLKRRSSSAGAAKREEPAI